MRLASLPAPALTFGFLAHGGEMGALIRARDWSATSLGPIASWPDALKTVLSIMLTAPGPAVVFWGSDRTQFYNDAYIAIAAEHHPRALGRLIDHVAGEISTGVVAPILDRVFAGETVHLDRHAVPIRISSGEMVHRFFTGSLQPVRAADGTVAGIFHSLNECGQSRAAPMAAGI